MNRRVPFLIVGTLVVAATALPFLASFTRGAKVRSAGEPALLGAAIPIEQGRSEGLAWQLIARRSDEGLCLEIRDEGGGRTLGCGFGVPERHEIGFLIHRTMGGCPLLVVGPVVTGAETVRLEFAGGERVRIMPAAKTGLDVLTFVAELAGRSDLESAVVVDAKGTVLGRRGLDTATPSPSDHRSLASDRGPDAVRPEGEEESCT